jgi:hypothetical protein
LKERTMVINIIVNLDVQTMLVVIAASVIIAAR